MLKLDPYDSIIIYSASIRILIKSFLDFSSLHNLMAEPL